MRRGRTELVAALTLAALTLVAGGACAVAEDRQAPSTAEVRGPAERRERAWIALRDVHPLWGGRDVYVEGSGQVVVRDVPRGGPPDEQRSAGAIPAEEARALLARAAELDVLRVKIPERLGVPDEARPTIVVHGASGAEGRLTKWENDAVPPLDELRATLNAIAERVLQGGKPAPAGRYDPGWRPFAAVALVVDCMSGRPNPTCDLSLGADHQELTKRLADLPALEATPEPEGLGMRGFVLEPRGVEGLPARVRVHQGTVWLGPAGPEQRVARDAHGLEAWLTEKARAAGLELPPR